MKTHLTIGLDRLSDDELLVRVEHLAQSERRATARLVAHLSELEERRLHLAQGCSSLFTYCTEVLHFSESAAYNRIEAARIGRKFPALLEALADGSLHLAAIRLLAPHITADNVEELLLAAKHRSKREIEGLVVSLRPQPPVPAFVRKLPVPGDRTVKQATAPGRAVELFADGGAGTPSNAVPLIAEDQPRRPSPPARPATVQPLAPERYKVQFTASAETEQLLREARELLRHRIPDGDLESVLQLALRVLVKKVRKQKFAAREFAEHRTDSIHRSEGCLGKGHPSEVFPAGQRNSRHLAASVRRHVWTRDGGRCTFTNPDGKRCTETSRLEFHHRKPYAKGGRGTTDNITIRCRAHNQYESELIFGGFIPGFKEALPGREGGRAM
jgi:hypothetical protein